MKVELIKKTERGTGSTWYHVQLNGKMVDDTFTKYEEKANEYFENIKKLVAQYPVDTLEVVRTEDV